MNTTSSALPRTPATTVLTDWLIVSPVVNALDKITVPMVNPRVINTANPGRRGTLRHANRSNNGFRHPAIARTIATTTVATSRPMSRLS